MSTPDIFSPRPTSAKNPSWLPLLNLDSIDHEELAKKKNLIYSYLDNKVFHIYNKDEIYNIFKTYKKNTTARYLSNEIKNINNETSTTILHFIKEINA